MTSDRQCFSGSIVRRKYEERHGEYRTKRMMLETYEKSKLGISS